MLPPVHKRGRVVRLEGDLRKRPIFVVGADGLNHRHLAERIVREPVGGQKVRQHIDAVSDTVDGDMQNCDSALRYQTLSRLWLRGSL